MLIFAVCYLLLANLGVNVAYHRYLAHKSFEMTPWFRYLVVFIGLPAGTPIQWAGNHRAHHRYADTEKDPHSPYYGGFWHAHCGWYYGLKSSLICFLYALAGPMRTFLDAFIRPRTNLESVSLAKDIAADPVFKFMSRPWVYCFLVLVHLSIQLGVAYFFFGVQGFFLLWVMSVLVYNLGDSVDSIGHLVGDEPYADSTYKCRATDNFLLGLLTFGDGFHASHHKYPSSARHGLLPGQWDYTFNLLKLLSLFGMVNEIKVSTAAQPASESSAALS